MDFMRKNDWLIIVLVINQAVLTRTKRTLNGGVKLENGEAYIELTSSTHNVVALFALFDREIR